MVVCDKFAWCHIGKTGGDITRAYFKEFESLLNLEIIAEARKHDSFQQRGITDDKILVANIRRLPAWILSHFYHFKNYYGDLQIDFKRDVLQTTRREVSDIDYSTYADKTLKEMLYFNNKRLKISYWLRCENILDDFIDFISKWTIVSPEFKTKLSLISVKQLNQYNHDINHYWTKDDIEVMYKNNPLWTEIENQIYK